MKRPSVSSLLILILLSTFAYAQAQERAAQNADLLREKIEQLESTDIKSKSPTVQDIYKRSLLRLYNQYSEALQQDIADLKTIQTTVGGTSAETLREVNAKIKSLTQEQNITAEKLRTLGGDLQVTVKTGGPAAHTTTTANQSVAIRPASLTADATASSATVLVSSEQTAPLSDSLNASMASALPLQSPSPTPTPASPPSLNTRNIYESSTLITGTANDCCKGGKVKLKLGDQEISVQTDAVNGYFAATVRSLKENEVVQASQEAFSTFGPSLPVVYRVRGEPVDILHGGPFGFLFTGAVFSQQNERFNQSDPFMGFNAGYVSNLHGTGLTANPDGTITTKSGVKLRQDRDPHTGALKFFKVNDNGEFLTVVRGSNGSRSEISELQSIGATETREGRIEYDPLAGRSFWQQLAVTRWELGFQGTFTATGRAATTTTTASTGTTGGTGGTTTPAASTPNFGFIASRKSFDIEANLWWVWFAANKFSIGPYFAWGASTALSPNELSNEPVTQPTTPTTGTTTGGTTTAPTPTVATNSTSDNDMKQYQQIGFKAHTYMFNNRLFFRTIMAYGRYEAFKATLGPTNGFFENPRNRFYGHLSIFPEGLKTTFGRQVDATPMFGVDINVGHGQDFPRFFLGYAIRINQINRPAQ